MPHSATRVLAVLELLQTHGRLGGGDMADRLGIDRRTLRRHIAALEDIGIPIVAERGRHGGYALMPGFKLPPMMFTGDEAVALSVGLVAARGLGLADAAPAAASAQAKLERIMPDTLRRRVRAIDETVRLDARGARSTADGGVLAVLSTAALQRQRVRLQYRDARQGETERDCDPYGLAFLEGRWYLVGRCHLRRGMRSFRLDRIVGVQPLPQSFGRPEGFDPLDHMRHAITTLPRAHTVEVLLKTDLATARNHLYATVGLLEETEGGVVIHNQSDDLDWFARQLATLPFGFEIRRPAALRTAVRALARRLERQCAAA